MLAVAVLYFQRSLAFRSRLLVTKIYFPYCKISLASFPRYFNLQLIYIRIRSSYCKVGPCFQNGISASRSASFRKGGEAYVRNDENYGSACPLILLH